MAQGFAKIKKKEKPEKDYPQAKQVTDPGGEVIQGAGGQDILVPFEDYILEYEENKFYPVPKNLFDSTYEFKI